jgi:hypothetical protein
MVKVKMVAMVVIAVLCGCKHHSADEFPIFEVVSDDGKMKFYCQSLWTGGTMSSYDVTCEYLTEDGEWASEDFREKEEFETAWVHAVYAIKRDDGKIYYLAKRSFNASSNDISMWMDAFVVDHDTLEYVSPQDGGAYTEESGWPINYHQSDWYSRASTQSGEDSLFEYNAKTRELYVPQTIETQWGWPIVSDRYTLWRFDGMKFVDMGDRPHKGLHSSLADYVCLSQMFTTEKYHIRVDSLASGQLRYASWKRPSGIGEKPDLIIEGGRYDAEADTYTFENDGVEYVVGYHEDTPVEGGGYIRSSFLLVKRNGKVIMKDKQDYDYNNKRN